MYSSEFALGFGVVGTVFVILALFLPPGPVLANVYRTGVVQPTDLLCRGPKDLVISPLLFDIYMKLLGEMIWRFRVRYHQYAIYSIYTPDHLSVPASWGCGDLDKAKQALAQPKQD